MSPARFTVSARALSRRSNRFRNGSSSIAITVAWSSNWLTATKASSTGNTCVAVPVCALPGRGRRPGEPQMITVFKPEQTELEDLEMVGRYALAPLWKDGHHTGIYTWRNLREMCPDCTAK